MKALLAGILVALALWNWPGSARVWKPQWLDPGYLQQRARPEAAAKATGGIAGRLASGIAPAAEQNRPSAENHKEKARSNIDLGMLVTEVATRLRSGLAVEDAWAHSLRRSGLLPPANWRLAVEEICAEDGVPVVFFQLLPSTWKGKLRRWWYLRQGIWQPPLVDATTLAALPGTIAACRLTHEVGAPLADVLDACAQGITEAAEAKSARAVALAGPISSARVLQMLPLVGMGIGFLAGMNPLKVILGGGVGTLIGILGVAFLVGGRFWVKKLVAAAEREHEDRVLR